MSQDERGIAMGTMEPSNQTVTGSAGTPKAAPPVVSPQGTWQRTLGDGWHATAHFRPVLVVTVLLFAVLAILQPTFATSTNLENMLAAVAVLWIISMGMTFALLTGGVDLSVSAVASLVGIFLAETLSVGVPGGLAIILAIVFGALVGGVLNGVTIGKFGLSFFVVTLATMTAITGVVNLWSGTKSFYVQSTIVGDLATDHFAGLQVPIWIMLILLVFGLWLQKKTYFGRNVYAVGGSMTAAKLSGIRTARTLIAVYALIGASAALAGVIAVGQIGAASPQVDGTLPLQAIAAVLLGGTSLLGGAGGVGGTAFGVLFIGVLQNGLSIAGIPSFWQEVVTGVILILAVGLGTLTGSNAGQLKDHVRSWFRWHRRDDAAVSA